MGAGGTQVVLHKAGLQVVDSLKPGQWLHAPKKNGFLVVYCCPICENLIWVLAKKYEIDDNGVMRPAMACIRSGCKFKARLKLEEW